MNNVLYKLPLKELVKRRDKMLSNINGKKETKKSTKILFELLGVIDWKKNFYDEDLGIAYV